MHVKLKVTPWKDDHATTLEDCVVLLVRGIEIGGEELRARGVSISLEGSSAEETGEGEICDFLSLGIQGMQQEQFDRLGFDQRTFESTPENAGIIVSDLEIEFVDA
jgi:hypothetical protein